ncbi:hypothetical protein A4X06_0g1430 [Tilletia controversa]|uniref:Acyltransferase 3 domain-containing protein n=1 Tax=Tilletia controversa TaxID=13291 RepID=A0A8X7SZK5_9BASI|nr:hypothetical protein CF328_g4156 [Tilletia controversa]KAE8253473.1 hypothetical protein A4X06_0g1430 [Tilletia controversa]
MSAVPSQAPAPAPFVDEKRAAAPAAEEKEPVEYSEHGFVVLKGKARSSRTDFAFNPDASSDLGRTHATRIGYLEGFRGLLALQFLIFTFFRLFAPAIVTDTDRDGTKPASFIDVAPAWHSTLRKALTPVLFDGNLQLAAGIILSGRCVLQTFVERRSAITLAGTAFRRPFRFILPLAVALAFTSVLSVIGAFKHAPELSAETSNVLALPPRIWESILTYVNSIVTLMMSEGFALNERGLAFLPPSTFSFVIPIIFRQTYSIMPIAWLMPYTVLKWKAIFLMVFITASWWSGRWVFYSATGLAIAELSVVYLPIMPRSINITRSGSIKFWLPLLPLTTLALGIFLKYYFASMPEHSDFMTTHVDVVTGRWTQSPNPIYRHTRLDDYLVAASSLLLLEISPRSVRALFDNFALRWLGRISFALFLTSGTIMLSLGSLIYHHMVHSMGVTDSSKVLAAVFFATVPVSLATAEIFFWLSETTSNVAAKWLFNWIRT